MHPVNEASRGGGNAAGALVRVLAISLCLGLRSHWLRPCALSGLARSALLLAYRPATLLTEAR